LVLPALAYRARALARLDYRNDLLCSRMTATRTWICRECNGFALKLRRPAQLIGSVRVAGVSRLNIALPLVGSPIAIWILFYVIYAAPLP
jgi:hypothetical protein